MGIGEKLSLFYGQGPVFNISNTVGGRGEGVRPSDGQRTGLQAEELSMIQTFHKVFQRATDGRRAACAKFGKPCR